MDQNDEAELSASSATNGAPNSAPKEVTPAQYGSAPGPVAPPMPCPTCANGPASGVHPFVYALGRIEARFPLLSVEKEFAQARARADATAGKTDQQVFT